MGSGGHHSFLFKDFEIDIFEEGMSDKVGDQYSVDHMDVKNPDFF